MPDDDDLLDELEDLLLLLFEDEDDLWLEPLLFEEPPLDFTEPPLDLCELLELPLLYERPPPPLLGAEYDEAPRELPEYVGAE